MGKAVMLDMEKDAKELLDKTRKQRLEMTKKPEARDAGPGPSPEKEKTKEELEAKSKADEEAKAKAEADKKGNAEAQAKRDEEILSKKDEELKDDEKKRKAELVKIKQDVEDKEKKSNTQKRFDELTAKIKDLENDRNSTKAERDSLKTELDDVKKKLSMTPKDKVKEVVKSRVADLRKKYLEEDKGLPRDERREMSSEELEEWELENPRDAQDWATRRTLRRVSEENYVKNDELLNIKAKEAMEKFDSSYKRAIQKHPELDITKRKDELLKEHSKDEARKILSQENPKWKLFMDIFEGDTSKFITSEDGAMLVVEEMEKRLNKPDNKPDTEKDDVRKELAELKAEINRLKGIDVGISSNRSAPEPQPEFYKGLDTLAKEVGLSSDKVKARVKERASKGYGR